MTPFFVAFIAQERGIFMPYKDAEKRKEAQRNSMARLRGSQPTEATKCEPSDWSDRRNYSDAYLKCLDEQGGVLTEKSKVAMKSWKLSDLEALEFQKQYGAISGVVFTPNRLRK